MLTSPNYREGEEYPENFDGFQRIQVPEGNTIWMQFTDFDLGSDEDFVEVTDKDGTTLGHFDEEESQADSMEKIDSLDARESLRRIGFLAFPNEEITIIYIVSRVD